MNGGYVGAQCKNTDKLSLSKLIKEVERAKAFTPRIEEYYFVVAADRDAGFQQRVREHFKSNPAPFRIVVLFWEDLKSEWAKNPEIIDKHYGTHWRPSPSSSPRDQHRCESHTVLSVEPNSQDVLQYLRLSIANDGTSPLRARAIDLELRWSFTDGPSVVRSVFDGLDGPHGSSEAAIHTRVPNSSRYELVLRPDGTIPPGESRTIGFVVARPGLVRRTGSHFVFSDPYHCALAEQPTTVHLVLPRAASIEASDAELVTSRSVSWRFNAFRGQRDLAAAWRLADEDAPADDEVFASALVNEIAGSLAALPPHHLPLACEAAVARLDSRRRLFLSGAARRLGR
ncbi:MAG: hypothetical protein RMA76_09290 [Deltaproteobacteria bacterium]